MSTGYTTKSTFLGASYIADCQITGCMGVDLEEETGVGGGNQGKPQVCMQTCVHMCTHMEWTKSGSKYIKNEQAYGS